MNILNRVCAPIRIGMAAVIVVASGSAVAAPAAGESADHVYQRDRAACRLNTSQSMADCLKEAAAARHDAKLDLVQSENAKTLQKNAMKRCKNQPVGEARTNCERMAMGEGTVTGTVASGGELKELTTTVQPGAAASAPKN